MIDVESLIKSANIYLVAKNKKLKYIYCSEGLAQLLNVDSPTKIIGKTDYDFHSPARAHAYQYIDQIVLKTGKSITLYEDHPDHHKTIKIRTTKSPLRDELGSIIGLVISFVPICFQDACKANFGREPRDPTREVSFFTKRECDVLEYIMLGYITKEIAKCLDLSPRTVEDHIENIKQKLQCNSKHQILEAAIKLGFVHH